MITRRKWLILALVLLAFIGLPYLFAALVSGKDYVFNGFLLNFGDSNSYLAKMYEGWNGSWRFTLPYTAEPGQGGYIFLFYLFLGHLARWLGLPLLIVYHTARIAGALLLLAALARFMSVCVGNQGSRAWRALLWAAFGSGLGWLLLVFGFMAADTWVVDAFPFLSAFAIPHFSLGMALMLWAFSRVYTPPTWWNGLIDFFIALGMGIIAPFSVVITLVVLGGDALWRWRLLRGEYWRKKGWLRLAWIALGGGPMLLYQFWLTRVDPVLAVWNAQNLTPSPAPWDLLAAFSPALLLAVVGGWMIFKRSLGNTRPAVPEGQEGPPSSPGSMVGEWPEAARLLVVWAVLGILLLYVPIGFQRRFIFGLYIPLVGLAVLGAEKFMRRAGLVNVAAFGLSLPTNLIILAIMVFSSLAHNPILYLTQDEAGAMAWIRANAAPHALVLAAPDTGTLIPANTGRRVIYGHLYETVNAAQEKQTVEDYFAGKMDPAQAQALLAQRKVDLVFCGPSEQAESGLPFCPAASGLPVVFRQGAVTLYAAYP
jgi:hypothetical protein